MSSSFPTRLPLPTRLPASLRLSCCLLASYPPISFSTHLPAFLLAFQLSYSPSSFPTSPWLPSSFPCYARDTWQTDVFFCCIPHTTRPHFRLLPVSLLFPRLARRIISFKSIPLLILTSCVHILAFLHAFQLSYRRTSFPLVFH